VAAAGGWLFAAGGPAAPPGPASRPGVATGLPAPVPPELRLGRDLGDLRLTGGGLEVPVLDTVEMLPRCHP
jgi:hypothetical protein